jgi:hypothetical protein
MRNEAEDHRNMWMSVLVWRSQFFSRPENPLRNDLQISRFQESPYDVWWGRKANLSINPYLSVNLVIVTWTCGSRHVQLYCIPSQPWRPVTALCSLTNVWYILMQGLKIFISKQNEIHLMLWCGLELPVNWLFEYISVMCLWLVKVIWSCCPIG